MSPTYAEAASNTVRVGLYVLNVGKLDIASGTFVVDFYLSMRCASGRCNFGSFEFMNGRATSIQLIENSTSERFWRVEADLYVSPDLQHYPFDTHTLAIRIEDTSLTNERITYQPDPDRSGFDPSISLVGWTLTNWNQLAVNHDYRVYNETYSQYIFSFTLSRDPRSSIAIFIPVFFLAFITLIAMLMYGESSTVLENRVLLTASTLVAAILFQFSLNNSLPPHGYLTFADKVMIATYGLMVVGLFIDILLLNSHHNRDVAKLERIQFFSIRIMPVVTVLVYVLTFWFLV